jgi:hypothetical protein
LWSRQVHLSNEHIQKSCRLVHHEDVWRNIVMAAPFT